MSKKLYLLAVGVNEFLADGVSNLNGCENDAKAIYDYLEGSSKNNEFEFDGKMLLSKEATKDSVVKHFREHLGKAEGDDIAVFYFSGHGAEEKADEVFHRFSMSENLTTVVCHDSRTGDIPDLADKEIRYLVNEISGKEENNPHFVLIMDSCHSGGTTRSMDDGIKPRLTGESETRDWSQFIFADEISKEDIANAAYLKDVLPEGEHVHLSSCKDDELAYEANGSGVFTSHLLDILVRTSGKVSYDVINSRTCLMLRGRFPQQPTVYSPNKMENEFFLGGATANEGLKGNIFYDSKNYKWVLDLGAVQGLSDEVNEPTQIEILNHNGDIIAHAVPEQCEPFSSDILINVEDLQNKKVDKRETYIGHALNVFRPYINFCFAGDEDGIKLLEEHFGTEESKAEWKKKNRRIVDSEVNANYVIRAKDGQFLITLPFDKRPLVLQLLYNDKETFKTLNDIYLHTISEWEYLSNVFNNKSRLRPKPPVEINVYKVLDEDDRAQDILLKENDGEIFIENGELIRIAAVNKTRNKTLHVRLFYLDMTFGVSALSEKGLSIKPESTYWVEEGYAFEFNYEEYIEQFNFEYAHFEFKLMCSTESIDNFYNSDIKALEAPVYPAAPKNQQNRPISRRKRPDSADWATHSLRVVIKNPKYKPE